MVSLFLDDSVLIDFSLNLKNKRIVYINGIKSEGGQGGGVANADD